MRTKLIFIAAIVMGLLTTFLFFSYMKRFDEAEAVNETTVKVVAAKQAIRENETVRPGMITLIDVPKKSVHQETVKTLAEAEGKIAESAMAAGEVVLQHRLKDVQEEALFVAKKIRQGYRAVSVGVNLVQSVSNLIEPGDEVDVVYIPPEKGAVVPKPELLLEKIKVLAVGRRLVETDAEHPYVEFSAVTLEVKPQDSVELVNADEKGTISLVLYSRIVPEGGKTDAE